MLYIVLNVSTLRRILLPCFFYFLFNRRPELQLIALQRIRQLEDDGQGGCLAWHPIQAVRALMQARGCTLDCAQESDSACSTEANSKRYACLCTRRLHMYTLTCRSIASIYRLACRHSGGNSSGRTVACAALRNGPRWSIVEGSK